MGRLLRHMARQAFDLALFGVLLALLLGPGQAWAQSALPGSRGGQVYQPSSWTTAHSLGGLVQSRGSSLVFAASFGTPGAFASGLISDTFQPITVTRASSATYCVAGSRLTATNNQLRVEANGALIEPTGTNSYLNSDTPATQTITLGTGSYILWMEGTGSQAAAVGTATAAGLPCTASGGVVCGTHGTTCPFTVSVGGTIVVTKTGSPTNTTVENSASVTSYIPTGGTAATRLADRVTSAFAYQLGAKSMCMQADVTVNGIDASTQNVFLEPYVDTVNVWNDGTDTTLKGRLNGFFASTSHVAQSSNTFTPGTPFHSVARYDGVNETVCVAGTCANTAFSFSTPTTFAGVVLGDDFGSPGTVVLNGNIKNIKLYANSGLCQ